MEKAGVSAPEWDPFDHAACGLLRTDGDGLIVRVNGLFCTWLGLQPDDLIEKRRFQDLLTMGGRIFYQTHWHPLIQIQGSVSEVKLEMLDQQNARIPMMVNAIRRGNGEKVFHDLAVFIARDRDKYEQELVRSRKKLEEVLEKSTRLEAEAKDRALLAEQMVGIVSHDLRNPLSTVLLGSMVLQRPEAAESHQRTLRQMARAVERASRLLDDLLDFTATRLGRGLAISKREVDMHRVVGDAVEELIVAYPGRALVHVREGAGLSSADPDRLTQLLGNLVSNAMAYGALDRPITVTSAVDREGSSLSVHNHGAPIPLELQNAIFQPMTRGDDPTSGRSVGLGLFIVSQIAKAHGGSVSVRSTKDAGTVFTFRLPNPSTMGSDSTAL